MHEQLTYSNSFNAHLTTTIFKGNQKILDIGCGSGKYSIIASQSSNEVLGLDLDIPFFNSNASELIVSDLEVGSLKFVKNNFLEVVLNKTFDVVFCLGVLHYLNSYEEITVFIKKIRSVTPIGGLVYISWISGEEKYHYDKFLPIYKKISLISNQFFRNIFLDRQIIEHQHGEHPFHKHLIVYCIWKAM